MWLIGEMMILCVWKTEDMRFWLSTGMRAHGMRACMYKHTSCIEMKREKKRKRNGLNTNARAVCTRRNELAKTASTEIVLMVAVVVWFV